MIGVNPGAWGVARLKISRGGKSNFDRFFGNNQSLAKSWTLVTGQSRQLLLPVSGYAYAWGSRPSLRFYGGLLGIVCSP